MNTATSDKFAVFILTHGRPNKVVTFNSLRKQGYTGEIYIIIDNEDKTADEYRRIYGDKVIVFDKLAISKTFDEGDNFNDRRAVIYARNASFGIARDLGLDYFLQLDDDYSAFVHKLTSSLKYAERRVKSLDRVFDAMLEYYQSISAVTIALAQNGDFLGGAVTSTLDSLWLKRKAMNTFFCSIHRPFAFVGRVNEDVNTYTSLGNRGALMFTVLNVAIIQLQTQSNIGGMTEMYLDTGTYIKSFYTVMYAPSCVTIYEMGHTHKRLHHKINWATAVPCIVSDEYRKANGNSGETVDNAT
jgi:glycosyltransferase involved in cell wall biosynthesis